MDLTVILIIVASTIVICYLAIGYVCMRIAGATLVLGLLFASVVDGFFCAITGARRIQDSEEREKQYLKEYRSLLFLWPGIFLKR